MLDAGAAVFAAVGGGAAVPNLTISAFGASPATVPAGGLVTLAVTVRNAGNGTSNPTTLRYFEQLLGVWIEVTACRTSIGALAPGASTSQSCSVEVPSTSGTDYFYAAVDPVALESVNWDNAATPLGVAVSGPSLPDLVVAAVAADGQAEPGGLVHVSVTVRNAGDGQAGASRVRYVLSPDAAISIADIDTGGYCDVAALSPSTTTTCSTDIGIPSGVAPGTYYLGAIADVGDQVPEQDESNNARAAAVPTLISSAYSRSYVQKAYVAYYGRPADPAGLAYWAVRMDAEGQSLDAVIGAFGNSDEFNRRYGGLTHTALVTRIYQQALGRDPDPAGLDWYVTELQAGRRTLQSITLDVLNGATTAPDSTVVANRLDVAAYYTAKVAAGCAYGTEQDGAGIITGVTADPVTVAVAKATIGSRCGL
jgi:hypothetical protein